MKGFTAEERAAMRERARELEAAARPRARGESEEGDVLARIAAMKGTDRTLGFSDKAMLDDDQMWPTSFALTALTATEEARIVELLKKARR